MRPSWAIVWLAVAAGAGCAKHRAAGSCDGPCPGSKINHTVIIVQENHTFDSYFSRYCTAATGSNPTCTDGPGCCETGPASDPGTGMPPTVLDDTENGMFSPNHQQDCELDAMNGGLMDKYVSSTVCGSPRNFAYADTAVHDYWQLAGAGALADRYFQPIAGASASNDMYLARAQFVFKDNDLEPQTIGAMCSFVPTQKVLTDPTIADLLVGKGVSWAWYAEGYQDMVDAQKKGECPEAPVGCAAGISLYPCIYDPGDVPFQFYAPFRDQATYLRDYQKFTQDLNSGNLPQVSFVKAFGFRSEHPGAFVNISDGVTFVKGVLAAVQASDYAPDTLVLIAYDEGGGYFDHVAPPKTSADQQPYGTRVPFLVVGPFAKKNFVSHVTLEHSSIVKFLEWNWLGGATGQLGGRDAMVENLGSLLDPAATGTAVP